MPYHMALNWVKSTRERAYKTAEQILVIARIRAYSVIVGYLSYA